MTVFVLVVAVLLLFITGYGSTLYVGIDQDVWAWSYFRPSEITLKYG